MAKTKKIMGLYKKSRSGLLKLLGFIFIAFGILAISSGSASATYSPYGSGAYGVCLYGEEGSTCSITITNDNTNGFFLALNVTPGQNGSCTVASDVVGVTTADPNGFTLVLGDQATSSSLKDASGDTIPTDSYTISSPGPLNDSWGYHVNASPFTGTATTENNAPETGPGSISSFNYFAGLKTSNYAADTINSSSGYSSNEVTTTIYYGICLDYSIVAPQGSYSSSVVYTATAN